MGTSELFEQFFAPLLDAQAEQLAKSEVPDASVFAVDDVDGAFLGQGAAIAIAGSPGGFEIGFQLRREAWGRGVGTRLAKFLCAFAIHRCGAYRIEGSCIEGNAGSQAILELLGLNLEGRRPGYRLRAETRHAEIFFGAEVSELDTAAFRQVALDVGLITA